MQFKPGSFDINDESAIPDPVLNGQSAPGPQPEPPDEALTGAEVNPNRQARVMHVENVKPFASYNHNPPAWIVEDLIPEGAVILMWGETGGGKSTFMHALAMAVANGERFMRRDVKRRHVLVLDRENSPHSLQEEFQRIGFQDGENLKHWGGWCGQEAPALGSAVILDWVKAHPDCLVIVDSYVAFFDGESENDAVGTRRFIGQARRIADVGGTVIYLHHPGKDPDKGPRGSSDIRPCIDVEYRFSNYDTTGRGFLDRITIKSDKTRFERVNLTVQYSDGRFTIDIATQPKTVSERLADLLRAHPGVSGQEFEVLAGNASLGRNRGRQFLQFGVKNGTVKREKFGTKHSYSIISPPPHFQSAAWREDLARRDDDET